MRPSERYRRDAEDLTKFREAYIALLKAQRGVPPGGRQSTLGWLQLREPVASASGPAANAYERHGGGYVNLVANWGDSLTISPIKPDEVLSAVDAAIANAERATEIAERRERGVTGVIAAFIRWPSTLREAVDPEHVGQARAAAALGHIGQGLVGVAASLIAYGLVALAIRVFG